MRAQGGSERRLHKKKRRVQGYWKIINIIKFGFTESTLPVLNSCAWHSNEALIDSRAIQNRYTKVIFIVEEDTGRVTARFSQKSFVFALIPGEKSLEGVFVRN
eukprot:gb/GECH01003837.1/.p1 GENE.gb/GECH01003837.1/~~gb/GECH01003837.1/.p1  ORF type:complete len:103 (+),score=5.90 gb/GECH01003837.1/:1-309(+)